MKIAAVLTTAQEFTRELAALINKYSMENASNTPDLILAQYLRDCLKALNAAIRQRDKWYGIAPEPGKPFAVPPA